MSSPEASRRENWFLSAIFVLALGYHLHAVTYHWTMGFMSGHEFRQAQTAITTYYIDQQNNFSLRYETPILGKPWVGRSARRDAEARHRDTRNERHDHDFQMGRAICAVDRMVHESLLPAFLSCAFVSVLRRQVQRLDARNVGIRL